MTEPRPIAALIALLDPIIWRAHFLVRLPDRRSELRFDVPVTKREWTRYWRATRRESRGYWHGPTGRIHERLGLSKSEWTRMCRFHLPEGPTSLGDSSHDYSYLIQAAGITCANPVGAEIP